MDENCLIDLECAQALGCSAAGFKNAVFVLKSEAPKRRLSSSAPQVSCECSHNYPGGLVPWGCRNFSTTHESGHGACQRLMEPKSFRINIRDAADPDRARPLVKEIGPRMSKASDIKTRQAHFLRLTA